MNRKLWLIQTRIALVLTLGIVGNAQAMESWLPGLLIVETVLACAVHAMYRKMRKEDTTLARVSPEAESTLRTYWHSRGIPDSLFAVKVRKNEETLC